MSDAVGLLTTREAPRMPRETRYLQVAEDLRRRIGEGEWAPGERLPGRGELGAHYDVGTNVIQRAQERLIIDGVLEGRAGSGTYVRTPRERIRQVRSRLGEARGASPFAASMRDLGQSGTWESDTTARVPAGEAIAERLGIDAGDLLVITRYEYFADGVPVQLAQSWEPMAITDGTPVVLPEAGPLAGAGVIARMAAIGVDVAYTLEVPRPGRATQAQANLLGIGVGDLVTLIERTHFTAEGRAVETCDIVIPDSRFEIAYEVAVQTP